jgi:glycosyltransferase involved in cell wall biosynthesis
LDEGPAEPAAREATPAGGRRERAETPGSQSPALSLVVPLYDEEGNVERVARELLAVFRRAGVPFQLVLVDNGSRDGTRAALERLVSAEAEVSGVYLDRNQGYGGGILAGMERARADSEVLGWMWGDGQVSADDAIRVYRRLVGDRADVAKARRVSRSDGWQRFVVTRVYNTAMLWWFHVTSSDANGCPKMFTRQAWDRLKPASRDWFLDPEVMIGTANQALRLAEVDVVAQPRTHGRSKVGAGTVVEFLVNLARARLRG